MPTIDRKPRARRRSERRPIGPGECMEMMRNARDGKADWDEIRPECIRAMARGTVTPEQAAMIFDAYRRRPVLLPTRPPGA